jgi:hypothetical protein
MEYYSPPLTRARSRKLGKTCSFPICQIEKNDSPKIKSRMFDTISTEDCTHTGSSTTSCTIDASINCEVKKVKLSKDELEMNGAPAGDIFDIKVLFDNELTSLAQPQNQIDSALIALDTTASTWADRYAAIEVIRRCTLFNPVLMTSEIIGEAASALIVELDSLRSCTIRNSVLCLQSLLTVPKFKEWVVCGEKAAVYDIVIGKLLLKSCSGPKFLCKMISEVLVVGAKALPFSRLSVVLLSFSSNKNSEVCNQIYIIACDNFLCQLDAIMTMENNASTIENSLRLFQKGINSVKPAGRDMAKKALKGYANRIGIEVFSQEVKQYFSGDQCSEMDREVKKVTAIRSKTKARVPLRALKPSNFANANAGEGRFLDSNSKLFMSVAGKAPAVSKTTGGGAKPWVLQTAAGGGGGGAGAGGGGVRRAEEKDDDVVAIMSSAFIL